MVPRRQLEPPGATVLQLGREDGYLLAHKYLNGKDTAIAFLQNPEVN